MVDRDSILRFGVATSTIGLPLILAGLINPEISQVNAEAVSSGTAIDLCKSTQWREPTRTGYPAPFGGMVRGDRYELRESLARWDFSVIIGDRVKTGTVDEGFISPQDLKITILHPDDGGGDFIAEFNAGNNIRYDGFLDRNDVIWDQRSMDKIVREAIEKGRRFQNGANFVVVGVDVTKAPTQAAGVLGRFTPQQADEFIRNQGAEEARVCATPTASSTSEPATATPQSPTVTSTPRALLTSTSTPTEIALSTITSTPTQRVHTPTASPVVLATPTFSADQVTAVDLCRPTEWREPTRTGYPAPFGGMVRGDRYELRESLAPWDLAVISTDSVIIPGTNVNEAFTDPREIKILILHPDDGGGDFRVELNAGNGIRRDAFVRANTPWDRRSEGRIKRDMILFTRQFQGAERFVFIVYNVNDQTAQVTDRFTRLQADEFIRNQGAEEARVCATATPQSPTVTSTPRALLTSTSTPTEIALSTITSTPTSKPTESPTAISTVISTPGNLNCGFIELVNGWRPDFRGGGDYPFGNLNTFVDVPIRTDAFRTSGLIASYLGFLRGGSGQLNQLTLDGPNEIVLALFPGGGFGTNWDVRLRARENEQLQTIDPPFGETPLAIDAMRANLVFRATAIKRSEGRSLDRVKWAVFFPDGFILTEIWNAGEIASNVRHKNCTFASNILNGNIAN